MAVETSRLAWPGLPSGSREWDNGYMQKSFTRSVIAVSVLAVGLMLPGSVMAQDTPPATKTQTPPTKTLHSPATKPRATGTAKAQAPFTLKTQKEKISYAIGMNIGTGMHRQSLQIDPNILLRGLKDALAGGKMLMTDEEVKTVMTQLQTDMRKAQQEKMEQAGAANKKEGEVFLAANKGKALVVSGSNNPHVQVIVNAINEAIGANGTTINWGSLVQTRQGIDSDLATLVSDIDAGKVGTLLVYGVNPAYDYYDAEKFKAALKKLRTSISFNDRLDETTELCKYAIPAPHFL